MKSESAVELKSLYNSTVDDVKSLKSLNAPVHHWDYILVPLISQRLDQKSLITREDSVEEFTKPSVFSELLQFLKKGCSL